MRESGKPHYAFIDCVRGYAALLVVLVHATYLFPNLPYPIHRLTVMGWHGVQLFFLASAVTLMTSWRHEMAQYGQVDVRAFFIRRFFRIAPAYYAASVLYFALDPPAAGFKMWQAAAAFLFVNAWHPVLMPTVPGAWSVVPGGWSIGVEFTFYAAFPFIAGFITSRARATWLVLATVLLGATLNFCLWPSLATAFGATPADNFLYFWFPNQMSVFALGIWLFFVLKRDRGTQSVLTQHPNVMASVSVVMALAVAYVRAPHWLTLQAVLPPAFLLVSLALMLFIMALACARPGLFLNRAVALMGRVSFSAYLLHFAILNVLSHLPWLQFYFNCTGWTAAVGLAFAMGGIVVILLAASWCTYRAIEVPMIAVGKLLIRRRRLALPQGIS